MDIIGYLKHKGKRFYPLSHTKAIYDNNGVVLENRLQQMDKDNKLYADARVADLVGSAPETLDTIEEVANAIQNNENVVDALNSAIGEKANKTDVNLALEDKLDIDGDASAVTATFRASTYLENISSGEHLSTIFGKIQKCFSKLSAVAFSNAYRDLDGLPEIPSCTSDLIDDIGYKTEDTNTTYTLTKDGLNIILTGSDGTTSSVRDDDTQYSTATASGNGLLSASDKSKLDGIASGANKYIHPLTHSASMITQDSTHRFVTDDEKAIWGNMLYNFNASGFVGIGEMAGKLSDCTRSTTITVGASNSQYSQHSAPGVRGVDCTCSGTNDHTVINQAIAALPESGGKIVLLEGTYNISNQIDINKSNVVIEGMGREATILQTSGSHHIFNITASNCKICSMTIKQSNNSKPSGIGAIVVSAGSHTIIRDVEASGFAYGISAGGADMVIDSLYSHDNIFGIYSGNGNDGMNFRKLISNCTIKNNDVGIGIEGSYNHIFGNNLIDNGSGIVLTSYGTPNKNQIQGNYIIRGTGQASDYTASQYTIQVQSAAKNNDFSNNYILGKNYVNSGGNTNTFVNNRYE